MKPVGTEHDAYALLEALMDCVGDWYKYTDDKVRPFS
jgi:hypothetical protein